jgi:hypothetical protein
MEKTLGMDKLFKNYAYPLNNYEWNYKGLVDNKYKPSTLGVNGNGSPSQFKHNLRQTSKYFDGLILDGNPNKNSIAGISDVSFENIEERIKKNQNASIGMPYLKFRNDYPDSEYPTNGKFSSSYFVQSGFCPVKSAKNEEECKTQDRNYTWIPNPINIPSSVKSFFTKDKDKINEKEGAGTCYKPRYSYINNAAESDLTSGMIPSLLDDVSDLNPAHLLGVSMGKPVMGNRDNEPARFQLLPCIEGFNNYLNKNINYQEKMLNENISKHMENFESDMAGSLAINRPEVSREYIFPNNNNSLSENFSPANNEEFANYLTNENFENYEHFTNQGSPSISNYIQEDFRPTGVDIRKAYYDAKYKPQPPFTETTSIPNVPEKTHSIHTKYLVKDISKVLQNGVKNNDKKEENDTIFGQNPIFLLLLLIFIISILYVGSY